MLVTKDQVLAEAKKLGITLDDTKVNAYILVGALPVKEETAPPAEDESLEDDKDLTKAMQERLRKEKEKRVSLKVDHDKAIKDLADLRAKEAARDLDKEKEKGNWEKVSKDSLEKVTKAEQAVMTLKEKVKTIAISSRLESELIKAGVPAARIAKAVKLFPVDKIGFEWIDEDKLESEIDDFASVVEEFKKDNDFLFDKTDEPNPSGYRGNVYKPGNAGKNKKGDFVGRDQFSALK